jgi:hypothetical protein
MSRKNSMYIDYNRSYKRRGRRRNGRTLKIILLILVALGAGVGTYYSISSQIDINRGGQVGNKEGLHTGSNASDGIIAEDSGTGGIRDEGTDTADAGKSNSELDEAGSGSMQPGISGNGDGIDTSDSQEGQEPADTRVPVKAKGLYLTSRAAMNMRDEILDIADSTEINALVIDVKDDNGKITYRMDSPMANEIGAITNTISDMDAMIRLMKDKGIYLIARIVAFKDPQLAEKRQNLAIRNADGSIYRDNKGECWVNPYKKEVWDYLIEVASKAAETGFDEIQFDYIRFSTGDGMSKVNFGEEAKDKTKEDIILEFTRYAYEKLKPLGVFVSADVYGTIISSSIDAGLVGQNYVEMSRYLDYICPMIYPSHFGEGNYGIQYPDTEPFNIVRKVLYASKTKLDAIPEGEHKAIVRPWLQDFTADWIKHYIVYTGREVREQISAVYTVGYEEWLLWDGACTYSVDGLLDE